MDHEIEIDIAEFLPEKDSRLLSLDTKVLINENHNSMNSSSLLPCEIETSESNNEQVIFVTLDNKSITTEPVFANELSIDNNSINDELSLNEPLTLKRKYSQRSQRKSYDIKKEPGTSPPEKKAYKTSFSEKWLYVPQFKDWLQIAVNPRFGFCAFCKTNLAASKKDLFDHYGCQKHQRNAILHFEKSEIDNENISAVLDEDGNTQLMQVFDLRLKFSCPPSREMRYAMMESSTGDTTFDTDNTVKEFEGQIAYLLRKEAGLFFTSSILANIVAVLSHCMSRGSTVLCGEETSIYLECLEVATKMGGCHVKPIEEEMNGVLNMNDLESKLIKRLQPPLTNLLCLESTHLRKGGCVMTLEAFDQILLTKSRVAPDTLLHLDGTRLLAAAVRLSVPPSRFSLKCHSTTFSVSAAIGINAGVVLAGASDFITRARFFREMLGGRVPQAGFLASASMYALGTTPPYIDLVREHATAVAQVVLKENSRAVTVNLKDIDSNIVVLHCDPLLMNAKELEMRLSEASQIEMRSEPIVLLSEVLDDERLLLSFHYKLKQTDILAIGEKLRVAIADLPKRSMKKKRGQKKKSFSKEFLKNIIKF